jgi:hypothetical protein
MGRLSPSTGIFFLCGLQIYTCLPINWMGVYKLIFLIPPVSYTINTEIIPIPVVRFIYTKRDIGLTTLGLGQHLLAGV